MGSEDRVAGHRTGISGTEAGVSKAENLSLLAENAADLLLPTL